jgi:hypothetical protein
MATLELVPLRSALPTGRLTLRHAVPAFNPVFVELPLEEGLITTTPQVAENGDGETAAGKGGEAR